MIRLKNIIKSIGQEQNIKEISRSPATQELSEEELNRLVEEDDSYYKTDRKTSIQHSYESLNEPDRLRVMGEGFFGFLTSSSRLFSDPSSKPFRNKAQGNCTRARFESKCK